MSNKAISELDTSADTLKNDDYILVSSKNDDGSFTSAKMLGSDLRSSVAFGYNDSLTQQKLDQVLSKLNEMDEKNISYFSQMIQLTTRMGNKVYEEEKGDPVTITLTCDHPEWASASPSIDPVETTYYKNDRVTLVAAQPKDPGLVKFAGWYTQGVPADLQHYLQKSLSIELTGNATYQAKYEISDTTHIRAKFKIVNNSSVNFASNDESSWMITQHGPEVTINANTTIDVVNVTPLDKNWSWPGVTEVPSYQFIIPFAKGFTYNQANISCSKSEILHTACSVNNAGNYFFVIAIPKSITNENYDGTFKDFGTITITNK